MSDFCHEIHILNVELPIQISALIDLSENSNLVGIKLLAHFFHHPNIAKEFSAEITISDHCLTNSAEMGVDKFDNLVLRTYLPCRHFIKFLWQALQFRLDDSGIYILFLTEIGIKSASALAWCNGDVIHCGALKSVFGKQLASNIYESAFCFTYRHSLLAVYKSLHILISAQCLICVQR